MALAMRLYPEEFEQSGADRLAELVIENGSRLETGIAGVSHLLPILSKYGHEDIAYRLLMQTEYPSWGVQRDQWRHVYLGTLELLY